MILLMGAKDDAQIQSVAAQLDRMQQSYTLFDSSAFPQINTIGYQPQSGEMQLKLGGQTLVLSEVKSMYWRNYMAPQSGTDNPLAAKDSVSLLKSVLNELGDKAKNSAAAVHFHQEKPRQLATVAKLGVLIPPTYVGNDAVAVRAFCEQHQDIIFKPVTGGDYAHRLTAEHLSDEHLQRSLRQAPVTLQRFITGTNIRSYVVGDEVFSAEIQSEHTDFRTDGGIKLEVIELPEQVRQQALAIKAALGLAWTGIDWRRDEQGDYYFLEANPSPMFANFEQYTGLPVAQRLAQLLAA
jgi:glutathione synthase/RimK-type ligase-like ATP-grasp enzyme